MIFDTDMLIWIQRGNLRALRLVEEDGDRSIATMTYLELLQGAKDRRQQSTILEYLRQFDFAVLPLTENIGHRASSLIEQHALSHGLLAGDALIAATALEHGLTLCTSNAKHFRPIKELKTNIFKP
jgi:predicted nucleic acid-binding protein